MTTLLPLDPTEATSAADHVDHHVLLHQKHNLVHATEVPRYTSLIAGQDDESPSSSNCTVTADTVNYKVGARAWKMTMSGAVTATMYLDPPGTDDPLVLDPVAAIGAWVYITDATKVTSLQVDIASDSGVTVKWNRSAANIGVTLVNGWNFLRWPASQGTLTGWGTMYRVTIVVITNAATDITVGHVWAECPPKAQIMFIADVGYRTMLTSGYPDLVNRGIPVTWAIDPLRLGTGVGTAAEVITEAEVLELAEENNNAIGMHAWGDGTLTSTMTAAELRAETMKMIKWMERRGLYTGRVWRAGFLQDAATNHAAIQGLVWAYATPSSASGVICWPPHPGTSGNGHRWNIPRTSLQGRTESAIDALFTQLEQTHGFWVCYTHGIHADGGNDMTPAEWEYFLGKLDDSSDWLEGVTFVQLLARNGIRFPRGLGDTVMEYRDAVGVEQYTRLP